MVRQGLAPPIRDLPAHNSDYHGSLDEVVELARVLTGGGASAIALCGGEGAICRARSGEGAPPLGARVDVTSGISKRCLDSGTTLWCEDLATDGFNLPEAAGIRAVAAVPIFRDDEIFGILAVFSRSPRTFSDLQLKWLQQIGSWVGSVENTSNDGRTRQVSRRYPPLRAESPRPILRWNDVFVDSPLPWKRFVESAFLHIVVAAMSLGLSRLSPRVTLTSSEPLRESHVIYYPSQTFPAYQSSRPLAKPRQQPAAHRKPIASRDQPNSDARGAVQGRKIPDTIPPSPAMPASGMRSFRKPALASAVPPAPDIPQAGHKESHLSYLPVVPPPPELSNRLGSQRTNAPALAVVPPSPDLGVSVGTASTHRFRDLGRHGETADIAIVPPAPSLTDRANLTYRATGVSLDSGGQVVPAPPTLQPGVGASGTARAVSLGNGVPRIVPPAPSVGPGDSLGGERGKSAVAFGGSSQVVPPSPSMQDGGTFGERRGSESAVQITAQVVPPPPSVGTLPGGISGTGRVASLARSGSERVLAPASIEPNPKVGDAMAAKRVSDSVAPEAAADRSHLTHQDVQLRVIGLAWAPPRSSYFSNFEVFIAEKWLNKKESQFIKLVYVFLPYQRRLSEYGSEALKARRLRVTRDSSCDENLMQIVLPEDKNGQNGNASGSSSGDLLPCYLTTADDYRRAISRTR